MYSQRVIDQTLDDFAEREGWRPFEHTVAEVEEFNELIDSIMDIDSNSVSRFYSIKSGVRLTQNKRDYIRRFIQNEQFYCFADALYFLTRYAYFCTVGDEIFRYEPRDSQKILHTILAEHDDLQVAIELFILKARQLGFSTAIALYFLHRILFRPNTRAVMASVQQKQSDLIGRIQETCWKKLPFWLPPPKTKLKTTAPEWANGSILSIQSGSQAFGIAQGWTPGLVHISEVGDVPNPKKTLEEGLFRATHSSRSLFFAIEGTGNRDSEWQYEKWAYYKANWGKGGRFRPFFVPPVCAKDLYPLPDWIRKNPIPANWRPLDETKRMQRKGELFVRSTDYLAKVMGSNFRMSEEYLWFWDCSYREAVASHTEKVFLSQLPCTDDEAFQSKSDKAFQDETIEVITNERQRIYMAYAITGKTILIGNGNQPYEPNPVDIDYGERRIPIRWDAPDGNHYEWELIPLKEFDDSDDLNCMNKLLVFRFPEEGLTYTAGVDTAQGLGGPNEDRSCISGDIVRGGKERDEQAFEFTSTAVNSPQMARIVACVSAWYGEKCKDPMGVKLAIEQVRKPGDECQHQLKLMGFYHHHRMVRYDSKGMPDPSVVSKEGWYTTGWSRSMMINKFMDAINAGWYKPNSPILIRQIKEMVREEKHGESWIDHAPGKHNDNFFAGGMGYFTAHDMDNNALRQEQRYRSDAEKNAVVDMRWASQQVTVD